MSFFNLQEINHHHHHDHHQNRGDHHHDDHMDIGGSNGSSSSRSYDCVFCQRGFTTAQALGGHMNIHRKDRANPSTTNKPNTNPNNNTLLSNKEMLLEEDNQVEDTNNRGLFYSSKSYLTSHNNGKSSNFEGRFHRFLGDHSSSLQGGSTHMVGKRVIQDYDHGKEREELDLELRLGHYSW